jgi:hypothetical protein
MSKEEVVLEEVVSEESKNLNLYQNILLYFYILLFL